MRIRMGRGGDELQPVSRRHPKLRSGGRRRERGGRVGGTGLRSATALGTIPFGSMDKFPLWISSCMPMNLLIKANRGPHASWCAGLSKGNFRNTEVMEDSLDLACVLRDAGDAAFRIHCLKRSAYSAVLRAFCAKSDLLLRAKEERLAELRNELKVSDTEHGECLVKASPNKHINCLRIWRCMPCCSAGLYQGNIGGTEVMKDSLNLACVIPDAGDTAFQFHCLERSAYATVLRAFCA